MNIKDLNTKKLIIFFLTILILFVIAGIYLFVGFTSKKSEGSGSLNSSMNGMASMGGMKMKGKNGMTGMNDNMTGKEVNNMGHRMFPQYKGVKTGPALFRYEGCFTCHTINGLGGGSDSPNLSHIGSIRRLSWIATQIVDPSAHFKRNSIVTLNGIKYKVVMPSFKNMPSKNVGILAKYLESLK